MVRPFIMVLILKIRLDRLRIHACNIQKMVLLFTLQICFNSGSLFLIFVTILILNDAAVFSNLATQCSIMSHSQNKLWSQLLNQMSLMQLKSLSNRFFQCSYILSFDITKFSVKWCLFRSTHHQIAMKMIKNHWQLFSAEFSIVSDAWRFSFR